MSLEELTKKYNKMQTKYGDKNLDAITFGGLSSNPDICFVFMNPTSKNIASSKEWTGPKSPWIGTKNIWNLFVQTSLFDTNIYNEIKNKKSSEWTKDFAIKVYDEVKNNKVYITNLGKCTQLDARIVPNKVYKEYLNLLEEEISIVNPKVIILFGNQVGSVFLEEKISVSEVRKKKFIKEINRKKYDCYVVFYPIGNGMFNIHKSIEDINWIKSNIKNEV